MTSVRDHDAAFVAGVQPHKQPATITPRTRDGLIGVAAQSLDRMLGRALAKADEEFDPRMEATRRAWMDNPVLMLRELQDNFTFSRENPGALVIIPAERWQLYADVMTTVMGRHNGR